MVAKRIAICPFSFVHRGNRCSFTSYIGDQLFFALRWKGATGHGAMQVTERVTSMPVEKATNCWGVLVTTESLRQSTEQALCPNGNENPIPGGGVGAGVTVWKPSASSPCVSSTVRNRKRLGQTSGLKICWCPSTKPLILLVLVNLW